MSWTYSGDPSSSDKDAVRFLIGDTNEDAPIMSDEEINYLLSIHGDPVSAAWGAANVLVAKYAQLVDKSIGPIHVSYSQRYQQFKDLAALLADQMTQVSLVPSYAGGLSEAEKCARKDMTDLVQPTFTRTMLMPPGCKPKEGC